MLAKGASEGTVREAEGLGGRVRTVRTNKSTVSGQRNFALGLDERKYPLVAYTDPDCIPEKGWLSRLSGELPADASAIGGSDPFEEFPGRAFNEFARADWKGRVSPRGYTKWLDSNNLLLRTADLKAARGFDESFSFCSDSELSARLVRSGRRLYFDPAVTSQHLKNYTARSFAREAFKYGRSHAILFLSGRTHGGTTSVHPGLFLALQPVAISCAALLCAFGMRAWAAGILAVLSMGWLASAAKAGLGPRRWPGFLALSAMRSLIWTAGGLSGSLEFAFRRLHRK